MSTKRLYGRAMRVSWWRHQMETFSALLPGLYDGNSPVAGEFPSKRPVTRSFDVFLVIRLNKRLSKQSWGGWFETPLRPLWRHCNVLRISDHETKVPHYIKDKMTLRCVYLCIVGGVINAIFRKPWLCDEAKGNYPYLSYSFLILQLFDIYLVE